MKSVFATILMCLVVLTACVTPPPPATPVSWDRLTASAINPSASPIPSETDVPATTTNPPPTITPTYASDSWQELPVYPDSVSQRVMDIYLSGQSMGNNPRAFSRMGDCDSLPFSFLGDFDKGPDYYNLGEYGYLEGVIKYFQGSWERTGMTAKDGFNTASMLSPLWADPEYCESGETPLQCEVRLNKPSFMLIALGSNDFGQPERFENNMRKILDYLIANGVVPILGTKADNLEGDHRINSLIGQLAYEYELPVWNFWRAVQPLDNHGIRRDDNYHPTHPGFGGTPNDFSNPVNMQYGFPWRNLTALQSLDKVMRGVTDQSN